MSISNIIAMAKILIGIRENKSILNDERFDFSFKLYECFDIDCNEIECELKNLGAFDIDVFEDWDGISVKFNTKNKIIDDRVDDILEHITIRCERCGEKHIMSIASIPDAYSVHRAEEERFDRYSYFNDYSFYKDKDGYYSRDTGMGIRDKSLIQLKSNNKRAVFELREIQNVKYLLCKKCDDAFQEIRNKEYPTDAQAKKAIREFTEEIK